MSEPFDQAQRRPESFDPSTELTADPGTLGPGLGQTARRTDSSILRSDSGQAALASGAADETPSPGQILADARKRQNLSTADITRQLRISARQLAALEADAHSELPGPVFVRGFIRNYARLLHIDPEPLLRALEPPPVVEPITPPAAPPSPTLWPYGAGALVLAAAVGIYFGVAADIPEAGEPAAILTPASRPIVVAEPAALPDTQPNLGGAPVQDDIKLVFKRESFVEIRDSTGKQILNRSNPPGTTQTVVGKPPYALVIGNAEYVQMTYQGESIDLSPHTKSGVARLTLN